MSTMNRAIIRGTIKYYLQGMQEALAEQLGDDGIILTDVLDELNRVRPLYTELKPYLTDVWDEVKDQ